MAENRPKKGKPNSTSFKPGCPTNPRGRPKLPEDIKIMKHGSLSAAVKIMYVKINDTRYIAKLRPGELVDLLALVFDRCGLPKVSQIEGEIVDTKRIVLVFPEGSK